MTQIVTDGLSMVGGAGWRARVRSGLMRPIERPSGPGVLSARGCETRTTLALTPLAFRSF